ncbi:MAG: DUF4159 domain-containing protein [Candidatus Glassbacteria bacterium]
MKIHVVTLLLFLLITTSLPGGGSHSGTVTFTIARLKYGGGGDWYNDPSIIPNLSAEINARTNIRVSQREAVVSASDTELFQYPFIFMTGHGNVSFSDQEVKRLQDYFEAGGFLYADDDYGMDESFRREMKKVFPDAEMVELPLDFPIYHVPYDFNEGLPKIHKHDGKPPQGFGIFLKGRLVVYYTYETNISDGWADPDIHGDPQRIREAAFRMGINIIVYAMTH